jgi:hypothetical protein
MVRVEGDAVPYCVAPSEIPREKTVHLNKFGGLALACLLTAGSLAACSSKKDTTVDAAGKVTTTTAAPSSGSSNSGGSSSDTSGSGSGSGAVTSAGCISAAAGYAKVLASVGALTSGSSSSAAELQTEYDALGASIPSGLKDDYQTVAKAYAQFAKDIKGLSFTDPASMGKLQKAESDLTNSDVKTASENIGHYFDNHCQS